MRTQWIAATTMAVLATTALAQDRVLHEFVADPRSDEGAALVARQGGEPEAILYKGTWIEAPEGGALRPGERALSAPSGMPSEHGSRSVPSFRPDRVTSFDTTVGYYEVFSPGITPFKRVTALDAVVLAEDGETPVLTVSRGPRRRVVIEGARMDDPERDPFWGSVVLDFSAGSNVPLPSVAPDSRIYTLRTEPETALFIEKDPADNFSIVAPPGTDRPIRVTFLTDAARGYFSAPIPSEPADVDAAEVPPIPSSVARRALVFASELGLRRGRESLSHAVETLVEHFRDFEESSQPPRDTGDIFLDLARGKKGVCRHRVYAFVITAQALGIPARFVQNEAHAWAEVKLGSRGWMRIDLGGAAEGLIPHRAEDAPLYEPALPDLLPRPPAYERARARANGRFPRAADVGFGADEPASEARSSDRLGRPRSSEASWASAPSDRSGAPLPIETRTDLATAASVDPSSSADRASQGPRVFLSRYDATVFRGREVHLDGRVIGAEGRGLHSTRVKVTLRHTRSERRIALGAAVTDETGGFRAIFGLPPDAPVGPYVLEITEEDSPLPPGR